MRRVVRLDLSPESAQGLEREQTRADARREAGALNAETEWSRARRNKPLREAFDTLRTMAGNRERCMYCGDAHGRLWSVRPARGRSRGPGGRPGRRAAAR